MNILGKINSDLKEFLKSGKSFEAGVLRMIISAARNKEIEKKGKGMEPVLSEEEVLELLFKEVKKRKESFEIYKNSGRNDLADKESQELDIIKKYMPAQASEEEINKIVDEVIKEVGATSAKEFGKVIGEAAKRLKGRADSSSISNIIKNKLK